MCRKLILLVCVIVVLGLVGSASATEWDGGGDGTSWDDAGNWDAGVPGPATDVDIFPPPAQGPIVNVDVNCGRIDGPVWGEDSNMVMEIQSGTVVVNGKWEFCRPGGDGIGTVTISGGDVTVNGGFKCSDSTGNYGIMNFTGGSFYSTGDLTIGEDGGGELTISGASTEVDVSNLNLPCRKESARVTFTMTGGLLNVRGDISLGDEDNGDQTDPNAIVINFDGGTIICNDFGMQTIDGNAIPFKMDFEEGALLEIRQDIKTRIQEYIDAGFITGKDDTEPPSVVTIGGFTFVGYNLYQLEASDPNPGNTAGDICPEGLDLTWTAGTEANQHKVFFGSFEDVNSMTDPCAILGDANYAPGPLEYGETYYWRVDEVNTLPPDPNTWRGSIWHFTTADGKASDPSPMDGQLGAPPSSVLTWIPACRATGQKLYFGTDFPESIVLFDDDFESGAFDPNWTASGSWEVFDANGDPPFGGSDANMAKVTGVGDLITVNVDATEGDPCEMNISFRFRKTEEITDGEIKLYYYDGGNWDYIADLNSLPGANDAWIQYSDANSDSQYFVSTFKIKLEANISSGTVYVDDVTVTNTWPVDPFWLEADLGGADNNYAPMLSTYQHYYWRVDTIDGGDVFRGNYWDFTTGLGGLLLELLFEGNPNDDLPETVLDTSSNDLDFTTYAAIYDSNASGSVKYAGGRYTGTSADFDPNAGLYRPDTGEFDPLRLSGWQYTIQFWVKPENLDSSLDVTDDDWLSEDFDLWLIGKFNSWKIAIKDPGSENEIHWELGGNSEREGTVVVGEWSHLAAIYDQTAEDDNIFLYINGELEDSVDGGTNPSDNNYPVTIGYAYKDDVNMGRYFDGCIDELRIWDIALEPVIECATQPYPENGSRRWDPNDPNLDTFTWKPGAYAANVDGHNIYFGDSMDDVNESADPCVTGHDSNSWTHGKTFTIGKTYYWRVDEVNGLDVWSGFIWKFQMEAELIGPNIVVYYPLDETHGDDVLDYSGRYFDAECDEDPHWEPDNGRYGGCMHFSMELEWDDDDEEWDWGNEEPGNIETESDYGAQMAALINKEISICVWVNGDPNQREDDDMVVFEFCDDYDDDDDEPNSRVYAVVPTEPTETGNVVFRAGIDPEDTLEWTGFEPLAARGTWQHFVFIKNENDANMYIYLNTELVATKTGCSTTSLADVNSSGDATLKLGAFVESGSNYHGRLDEFQIYNKALDELKIQEIFRGGELEPAWSPSPYDGQGNVAYDIDYLTWKPGVYVADTNGHEVYFGTNYDEVFGANTTVHSNVEYSHQDACSYDPCGLILELGQTYYWRVDEVNDPCLWRGRVWKFTTANFITIDDFEDDTVQDPPSNDWDKKGTSAVITLRSEAILTPPEIIGKNSMKFVYNNWWDYGPGFYSEIESISLEPDDWTILDQKLKLLSLWFYGNSANAATEAEQMYVYLKDNDDPNNEFQVKYGDADWEDMNDVKIADWQEWLIPLSHFSTNDVNLANLDNLCIGFGIRGNKTDPGFSSIGGVYFDNIRLYPSVCAPWGVFEGDLNGDCVVDSEDVEIMAGAWLDSDCNCIEEYGSMPSPPGEPSLVAWYEFNDGSGDTATDSTSNDNDGTISVIDVNVFWFTGHEGGALDFDDGWVSVPNGPTELNLTDAVTVSCWINRAQTDDGKIVVKGRNDWETYALEVNENRGRFFVRDANDRENQYSIDSSRELPVNSWIHVAGTYDGNELTLYVNGRVAANSVHPLWEKLVADANDGLVIAGRWGDTDGGFIGTIDDVRIYDYALSGGEICYIASDGDGVAEMVNLANVFKNESKQAVNLKDFVELANNWLKRQLWPL